MDMSGVLFIIILVIIIMLVVSITLLILHIIKFRKYVEKYNKIFRKFENKNIEKDIEQLIDHMNRTRIMCDESKTICDSLDVKMINSIQKVGIVKYDAYDGGNNGLSFSLTLLDGKDDGIIINSVYTRNGSNIYAKEISNGEYVGNLSHEEQKSLQVAKNKKSFM